MSGTGLGTRRRFLSVGVSAVVVASSLLLVAPDVGARASTRVANPYCGVTAKAPQYHHVIVIAMENHSYSSVVGTSSSVFVDSLIAKCALATNDHNVTHYSLPNYLALTSGMTLAQLGPYVGDCSPTGCSRPVTARSIFAETVGHGGWRAYDESMPVPCDRYGSGEYAPRHNPAVYYTALHAGCPLYDIALGPTSSSSLLRDFTHEASAPAFAFVTPNLCHDTHDCSVAVGDAWLHTWVSALVNTPVYRSHDVAIIVTWDEGEPSSGGENCVANLVDQSCHVAAIIVAPSVHPGTRSALAFSHYSVLATAEDLLHLPRLNAAVTARSMVAAFNL